MARTMVQLERDFARLQKAHRKVAMDDLDMKERVAELKEVVDIAFAAIAHPKKAKPRKRAR